MKRDDCQLVPPCDLAGGNTGSTRLGPVQTLAQNAVTVLLMIFWLQFWTVGSRWAYLLIFFFFFKKTLKELSKGWADQSLCEVLKSLWSSWCITYFRYHNNHWWRDQRPWCSRVWNSAQPAAEWNHRLLLCTGKENIWMFTSLNWWCVSFLLQNKCVCGQLRVYSFCSFRHL